MRYSETTLVRTAVVFLMLLGIVIYSLAYSRRPLDHVNSSPNQLFQANTQSTHTASENSSINEVPPITSNPILVQKNNPIQLTNTQQQEEPQSDLFTSTPTITTNTNTLVPGKSITKISKG